MADRSLRQLAIVKTMKRKIYTVHAYRWGDKQLHSYLFGVYSKKHAALNAAEEETEYRGGKYTCEVIEWIPDGKNEDGSPGMPHTIIQQLPWPVDPYDN